MNLNPVKKLVNLIDSLTITKTTTLLFLIMVMGMLFIGSFSHISLSMMRDNFNILYGKRMLPVIRLEKIKDIFSVNILDTLRDIENENITFKQGWDVISLAQDLMREDWREYKKSFDIDDSDVVVKVLRSWGVVDKKVKKDNYTSDEKVLAVKIEQKIDFVDSILNNIFKLHRQGKKQAVYSTIQNQLYPTVYSINADLTQLININLDASKEGKENINKVYRSTFKWIIAGTIGTIAIATLIAFIILQNIRFLHNSLESRVKKKTKELRDLNRDLELKIKKEVEKSREKDEIMFRQSRLAAMGEMIGNIAHQWRQPLNALSLVIQSFQTKRLLGMPLSDNFIDEQVKQGSLLTENMSKTIDDFRNFFDPNKKRVYFDIKENITKNIELLSQYYKKYDVSISLICKQDFKIFGYQNEFSQVIINLFSNSKDALNDTKPARKLIEVQIYSDDKYGYIEVIDNGGGIKQEIIDRIFDPYFTTKHKSAGAGIGLYMSAQIIEKQMDGELRAENCSHIFEDYELEEKCAKIIIRLPLGG